MSSCFRFCAAAFARKHLLSHRIVSSHFQQLTSHRSILPLHPFTYPLQISTRNMQVASNSQDIGSWPVRRVLSIQSHVVSGYVGNKSATFPLQVLGYDVDALNSVQFSNHTGYPSWRGQRLGGEQLWDLFEGLETNNLDDYSHLLTGYIGSASFLETVIRVVTTLKEKNENFTYVCDPVMGDDGRLYVAPDLVPLFRDKLAPLASILTPNQFEAELLTGTTIQTNADVLTALDLLHAKGIPVVVITSCTLSQSDGSNNDQIWVYGSSVAVDGPKRRFRVPIQKLPASFTGTGDLFSALLLAWTERCNGDLAAAVQKVLGTLQGVLQRTLAYRKQHMRGNEKLETKFTELRLIQSKSDIEAPGDHAFPLEML
eukprot:comp16184_c0_seq1/m.13814 comp16184_c0_seq1/g.13814  ORF comp16184_c0_seq1/g.13814 comp16184_c0_seq1/m.13814 type:complete len:371 (-) comp16184_c0_seq1:49-1161(-)